ncbi:MAG TPA: hypothetical protein VF702_06475 [Allosphingosinicella sp.]|jgi:hypothetical protein
MWERVGRLNALRGRVLFWVLVFVVVVGGGAFLAGSIRTLVTHSPVDATVLGMEEECSLVLNQRRRDRRTHRVPCDQARVSSTLPQFAGWTIVRHEMVRYSYVSPADGRTHEGRADRTRSDPRDLRPGSTIRIWAHKGEPLVSRRGLF